MIRAVLLALVSSLPLLGIWMFARPMQTAYSSQSLGSDVCERYRVHEPETKAREPNISFITENPSQTTSLTPKPKPRMLAPLLLTHMSWSGTKLLNQTLPWMVNNFLVPQGNIDLVLFYTKPEHEAVLMNLLNLTRTEPDEEIANRPAVHDVPTLSLIHI